MLFTGEDDKDNERLIDGDHDIDNDSDSDS